MKQVSIPVIVFMLIAAGWFYTVQQQKNKSDQPKNTAPGPAGFGTETPSATAARILLEAEEGQEVSAPAQIKTRAETIPAGASNEKSCYFGPEKWNETWKAGQVKGTWEKGHPKAENPGFIRYSFEAPAAGSYEVWIRTYWVDDCGNSLHLVFGDPANDTFAAQQLAVVSGTTFQRWTWNKLVNSEMETKPIPLQKGTNTLTICNREDDVYIDQILIRSTDADWPDPTGIESK